jgi:hypothetical protein
MLMASQPSPLIIGLNDNTDLNKRLKNLHNISFNAKIPHTITKINGNIVL